MHDRWHNLVAGDYEPPAVPELGLLRRLLENCYLAASFPEEGRYPQYNVIALPKEKLKSAEGIWLFNTSRSVSVPELRRLAPAIDVRKSAILVVWAAGVLEIAGLADLGTSWGRARAGLGYAYRPPETFLVQIDRPGRLHVYQGGFLVATLSDGQIEGTDGLQLHLFLHNTANRALERFREFVEYPIYEEVREFAEFEFITLWNTYASIANAISASGHGGMLVIWDGTRKIKDDLLRLKYQSDAVGLSDAFIGFLNARNITGDHLALAEDGHWVPEGAVYKAELDLQDAQTSLVEATRFVAQLAGCDGAIIISDDLRLLGFGAEIRAEISPGVKIF